MTKRPAKKPARKPSLEGWVSLPDLRRMRELLHCDDGGRHGLFFGARPLRKTEKEVRVQVFLVREVARKRSKR